MRLTSLRLPLLALRASLLLQAVAVQLSAMLPYPRLQEIVKDEEARCAALHGVPNSRRDLAAKQQPPFKSVGTGNCSTTQAEVPPRADWFIYGHTPVRAT